MTDEIPPPRPHFDPADIAAARPERVSLRMLIFLGIAVVLINSVISTTTVVLIRSSQVENRPTVDNTNYLVGFIKDCVTPGGECYRDNLRSTARELGAVDHQNRRVSAAAAACSVQLSAELVGMTQHQASQAVYGCLQDELAKKPQ